MNPRVAPCPGPNSSHPTPARRCLGSRLAAVAAIAVGLAFWTAGGTATATSVRHMDLAALTKNADKIFRGTVVGIREGSLNAGGGTIPTITYRIEVSDGLAGQPNRVAEFTAVGHPKKVPAVGGAIPHFPIETPDLKVGREYLLFVTRPSRIGLSSIVGLGQGAFEIRKVDGKDFAINQANNLGLGAVGPGPAEYGVLATKVRSLRAP